MWFQMFLDPQNKKYPICTKGSCKVNKKGLRAAYSRSRQWRHEKIASKAKKKLNKKTKTKSRRRPRKSRRPKKSKI